MDMSSPDCFLQCVFLTEWDSKRRSWWAQMQHSMSKEATQKPLCSSTSMAVSLAPGRGRGGRKPQGRPRDGVGAARAATHRGITQAGLAGPIDVTGDKIHLRAHIDGGVERGRQGAGARDSLLCMGMVNVEARDGDLPDASAWLGPRQTDAVPPRLVDLATAEGLDPRLHAIK